MNSNKNILIMSLVLTGTLLSSKTHSKPVFLNSELDLNKCSLSFPKNLNKVNSKILNYTSKLFDNYTELNISKSGIINRSSPKNEPREKIRLKQLSSDLGYKPFTLVNYITHNTSSMLAKKKNLIQISCNDNSLSGDQNQRAENCSFYESFCFGRQEIREAKLDFYEMNLDSPPADKNIEVHFAQKEKKQSIPFDSIGTTLAFEGEKKLREVKVDASFSSPASSEWDSKNCDQCLSRHNYQYPKNPSKFTSVFEAHILKFRLRLGESISKVIHGMDCQQEWGVIVQSDLQEVNETIRDLLQNSNCDFDVETTEDKNILDVSTAKKNFIVSKNKEIELIAKTIWGEGRGESYEGKVAIGNVIINRYNISQATRKSHWWGNTIEEIILHPYQFSCHNHNDPNKSKIAKLTTEDYQYRESLKIARGILSGAIKDNTFGATHYFAYKTVQPRWASKMKKTKRIGNHDFYKK